MAYKIGTTTVINDSRQLQNIATLDSTTTSTVANAIGVASYSLHAQYGTSVNGITVPSGKTKAAAFVVGGGGGGSTTKFGGTGGYGGHAFAINSPVTGGTTTFNVAIGAGGQAYGNGIGGTSSMYIANGDTKYVGIATGAQRGYSTSYGDQYIPTQGASGTGRMGFAGNAGDPYQLGTTAPTNLTSTEGQMAAGGANMAMQAHIPITAAQSGYQAYLEKTAVRPGGTGGSSMTWTTSLAYRPGAGGIHAGPISDNNYYSQTSGGVAGTVWVFFA